MLTCTHARAGQRLFAQKQTREWRGKSAAWGDPKAV